MRYRLSTDQGQDTVEWAGVLLFVALVIGAVLASGVPASVASAVECNVNKVFGRTVGCAHQPGQPGGKTPGGAGAAGGGASGAPTSGPAIGLAGLRLATAPGGVKIETTCTVAPFGGAHATISFTGTLELTDHVTKIVIPTKIPAPPFFLMRSFKREIESYAGRTVTYSVIAPTDDARAIEGGNAPNPVDPTSIKPGTTVVLDKDTFNGLHESTSFELLRSDVDHREGEKISASVTRIAPTMVRLAVGDSHYITNNGGPGIGIDQLHMTLAGDETTSSGALRTIDLDISTPAGQQQYADFIRHGKLPTGAGASNERSSHVEDWSGTPGGSLHIFGHEFHQRADSSHLVETKLPDGSSRQTYFYKSGDVSVTGSVTTAPDGTVVGGPPSYGVLLHNVNGGTLNELAALTGDPRAANAGNRDVYMTFDTAKLQAIRGQAIDHMVYVMTQNGYSPQEARADIQLDLAHGGDLTDIPGSGQFSDLEHKLALESPDDPGAILTDLLQKAGDPANSSAMLDAMAQFSRLTAEARGRADTPTPGDLTFPPVNIRPVACSGPIAAPH